MTMIVDEEICIYRFGAAVCGVGSAGRGRAGAAHHPLSVAGLVAALPFVATAAAVAAGLVVREVYPLV